MLSSQAEEAMAKLVGPKANMQRVLATFRQLDRSSGRLDIGAFRRAAIMLRLQLTPSEVEDVFETLAEERGGAGGRNGGGGAGRLSIERCADLHRDAKLGENTRHLRRWVQGGALPTLWRRYGRRNTAPSQASSAARLAAASAGKGLDLMEFKRLVRRGMSIPVAQVSTDRLPSPRSAAVARWLRCASLCAPFLRAAPLSLGLCPPPPVLYEYEKTMKPGLGWVAAGGLGLGERVFTRGGWRRQRSPHR